MMKLFDWINYPLLRNHKTDKECDAFMKNIMDNHNFELVDEYYVKIGNVSLWIANYPYACFIPCISSHLTTPLFSGMPSRKTVLAIYRKIKSDTGIDCKYPTDDRLIELRRREYFKELN